MRPMTLDEVLTATAIEINRFKALRIRKQLALAFGQSDAYTSLRYIELDGVALMLADAIAKSHTRKFAAQVVRVYWDVWGQCVAISEADASQPVNFCIVDFRDKRGKTAHMVCGAAGNVSQDYIALKLASTPQAAGADAERIVCVNVTRLIRFMRETGAKHGINLIGSSFLPPPDDPRTAALLAPCTEAREQAVEVVEALKAGDEQRAKRAGMLARSALEAMIPMPEGTRLQ